MAKLSSEEIEMVKKYGHLFTNTGGNDPVELMQREGVNYFNNPLVAELQGSCYSQTVLLLKLQRAGLLASPEVGGATCRLLAALDAMDRGCREPGFRGHQNGLGEDTGDELQDAREALAALVGHVPAVEAADAESH